MPRTGVGVMLQILSGTRIVCKQRAQMARGMGRGGGGSGVVYVMRLHCQLQRATLYFLVIRSICLWMTVLITDERYNKA